MSANPVLKSVNPVVHQHYRNLPPAMYKDSNPDSSPAPSLIEVNQRLLQELGIDADWFHSNEGLSVLSGNAVNPGNQPIAMAYSGHQFGHWVPLLGDGRAHMLGQMLAEDGTTIDVQLKGSGRTHFSRGGDGRATLGSVIREYLISEAMAGLGIATTRAIAILGTGEAVMRESALPGAVLVRSARSHIRVGSFQYASANLGEQGVKELSDFMISRYFPELEQQQDKYLQLLHTVVSSQASLIAQWMLVGFIHGVMNTDNMSIIGETIDYGPCAFMDEFHPQKVFSSIDRQGRYAWDQQPNIAYWNLSQFAATLLPLLSDDAEEAEALASATLEPFADLFRTEFYNGMQLKLGAPSDISMDRLTTFTETTLTTIGQSRLDFTVFFDHLTRVADDEPESLLIELFDDKQTGENWLEEWQAIQSDNSADIEKMRQVNPAVIARNHRVEEAITAAELGDFDPFRRLCHVLANPYEIAAEDQDLQTPPRPEERVTQTFCGT